MSLVRFILGLLRRRKPGTIIGSAMDGSGTLSIDGDTGKIRPWRRGDRSAGS